MHDRSSVAGRGARFTAAFSLRHLLVLAVLLPGLLVPALAFRPHEHKPLENFEKRNPAPATANGSAQRAAVAQLAGRVPGAAMTVSDRVRHVGSTRSFLTGPDGVGRGVSAAFAGGIPANDPDRALKGFLNEHRQLFGHGAEALGQGVLKRDSRHRRNGVRTVVWQQELDGIPVFNALLAAHTTAKGELVSVTSAFVPDLGRAANRIANRAALRNAPAISSRAAVVRAAENVGESVALQLLRAKAAGTGGQNFSGGGLIGESNAKLVWYPLDEETLRLSWEVIVTRQQGCEMFRVLVDAETGEVLVRHCLTAYISPASYRVFTSDSPTPLSPGHATPITNQPPVVSRTLVTLDAYNTNASPSGWINDGDTSTLGNNVDAHLDRNADNSPDLPRPDGTTNRVFDFPLNLGVSPLSADNQRSAVVNLFYWCNWMHDRLYELGFDEAAGNFQTDNFGRGGIGGDAVQADAQDGAGSNNANFSTLPDGIAPRMQMFIFDGPSPDIDGDFDAEVILHEYTHGLSNRRVGNGTLISSLQTVGMGEGWSDFYALSLLADPDDPLDGNYAMAAYVSRQLQLTFGVPIQENYYFGIRRYPYSTNLAVNPLTLKDIDPSQIGSYIGIPRNPSVSSSATAVHNMGEIWCSALWDARARLIEKHGFAVGNELILQIVTDAMGLGPANPTFLQARDAVLQADLVNNGGANQIELWSAFAKRGMGFSASVPAATTTAGVIEAFDIPDDLGVSGPAMLVVRGPVGGPFSSPGYSLVLTNLGTNLLNWSAAASTNWLTLGSAGGSLTNGETFTNLVTLNSNTALLPAGVYTNRITLTNLNSGITQQRTVNLLVGQPDYYTKLFMGGVDSVNIGFQRVTLTPDGSTNFYALCREPAAAFPVNPATGTSVTLADDAFQGVTLTNGQTVSLYGQARSTVYIGSNGYLTFDSGDTEWSESLAAHFNRLRISAFFVDLNLPASPSGRISWQQLPDRFVATWENVRRYGSSNENSFQVEMFFDGRIRITWLALQNPIALVGLSRGTGTPSGFVETDFLGSAACPVPVTLALPSPVTEGSGVLTNAGSLTIPSALTNALTVSLVSSATNVIAIPHSVLLPAGQTSVTFNVAVGNDSFAQPPRTVAVSASGAGVIGFTNIVSVIDDEPHVLTLLLPATIYENAGTLTGQGRVLAFAPPISNLTVSLLADDPARLQLPATITIPAGQTSAVFNPVALNNTNFEGVLTLGASAGAFGWSTGSASFRWIDDELYAADLANYAFGVIQPVQFVNVPFNVGLTALTTVATLESNYAGTALLSCLQPSPDTNATVRVLAFTAFTDLGTLYPNTLAAIAAHFTNTVVTSTTATNLAQLRTQLAANDVFLIPDQSGDSNELNQLGAAWSGVLGEFVARGGVVIACNYGLESTALLNGTGLLAAQRTDNLVSGTLSNAAVSPLTETLSNTFSADFIATFTSSNATTVVTRETDGAAVVLVRGYGLGWSVLVGTDFFTTGSGLDRVLANAVRLAQATRQNVIPFAPALAASFLGGEWNGAVNVSQTGSNFVLLATDGFGRAGLSAPFSVRTNTPPAVSNLAFLVWESTKTNLQLVASDPDPQSLSFTITTLPTNGLLGATSSVNGVIAFTPVHAFTGVDEFWFTVSDGMATSAPVRADLTIAALADSDSDGIPDVWEFARGLLVGLNDANEDSDGDGLSNRGEYLANTDPTNALSGPLLLTVEALTNGFHRLHWTGYGAVRYRLTVSDADTNGHFTGTFTNVVLPLAVEMNPNPSGVASPMSFTDDHTLLGAPTNGARFYELRTLR